MQSRLARTTGPLWYEARLNAEHGLGPAGDERFRSILPEAIGIYPHHFRFYVQAANHLLPRWYGKPGELARFGEAIARALPDSVANATPKVTSSIASCASKRMRNVQGSPQMSVLTSLPSASRKSIPWMRISPLPNRCGAGSSMTSL